MKLQNLIIAINRKIYNNIKRLYQNTTSCIKLNSINTELFNVKNDVRQGDSLSPTLFNVYVNDLVSELNSLNMGIDINGRQICCLLYADVIYLLTLQISYKCSLIQYITGVSNEK